MQIVFMFRLNVINILAFSLEQIDYNKEETEHSVSLPCTLNNWLHMTCYSTAQINYLGFLSYGNLF